MVFTGVPAAPPVPEASYVVIATPEPGHSILKCPSEPASVLSTGIEITRESHFNLVPVHVITPAQVKVYCTWILEQNKFSILAVLILTVELNVLSDEITWVVLVVIVTSVVLYVFPKAIFTAPGIHFKTFPLSLLTRAIKIQLSLTLNVELLISTNLNNELFEVVPCPFNIS